MRRSFYSLSLLALVCSASAHALDGTSEQTQLGTGNQSSLTLSGSGSATTFQDGALNRVVVVQQDEGFGHVAQVEQRGEGNDLQLTQVLGNGSVAQIYQNGAGNQFVVNQEYYANTLDATATGHDNRLTVYQGSFGEATTVQTGDRNDITVSQFTAGYGGGTTLTQTGNDNVMALTQTSGQQFSGMVQFDQVGNFNQAVIDQGAEQGNLQFTQQGDGNVATIDQYGRAPTIRGRSVGNDNEVTLRQSFDDPVIDLVQEGNGNLANVDQSALYVTASVTQLGDANQASVQQLGGFAGGDSAVILQQGTANVATVLQQ